MSIINWLKKPAPNFWTALYFKFSFLQYIFHQRWPLSWIFCSIYIWMFSCLLLLVSQLRMCFHQPISFVMWLQSMQNRSISSCIHFFYKLPSPQHATGYVTSLCWFCGLHLSSVSHDPHCWALIYRPVIVLNVIDCCWVQIVTWLQKRDAHFRRILLGGFLRNWNRLHCIIDQPEARM